MLSLSSLSGIMEEGEGTNGWEVEGECQIPSLSSSHLLLPNHYTSNGSIAIVFRIWLCCMKLLLEYINV